jgi:SIR2-like domain
MMTNQTPFTLDEILAIPGNRAVFAALAKLMAEEKAIAFVGAGASAGMYPLWGKFIELLADHAVEKGKAAEKDAARWKADKTSSPQQRVNNIVRRLSEPLYRHFLKETFGPQRGADGKRYTPTHAALLRLPFRGYVTTNYDPALDFARGDHRRDCLTTGTPTWQDDEEVHRWLTGDIFVKPGDCPILWVHGYWQRPNGIVLNAGEYAQAYKPGLYRKTFERLWVQDHLVFAGFGFNDPQFTFMVGEMMRDIAEAHAEARHIAILGLPLEDGGALPDNEAIREWRENLEADYHVRALFYPVAQGDHSALQVLLEGIAAACGCAPSPLVAAASPPTITATPAPPLYQKWFHETSNDDKFTGREEEMERLDRWVRDTAVRAIGVTAVGGTGKTALIGHWLKNTDGWRSRPFAGLFGWSFYQERDTARFLVEFLLWAHETFGTPEPNETTKLIPTAVAVLREHPLVIVLDGLEVLQEGPEDARHGTFLDGTLREFLAALCQWEHNSLAVLTSRFVFADLERHLGTAFHQIELHGLPPEQGASLLADLDVRGAAAEREQISKRLEGHPLGLRVFADAMPDSDRDHPLRFLDYAFRVGELPAGAPLNDKLRRLLVFYEKKLPPVQVRLLSVVALFRSPVADETVLRLVDGLFGEDVNDLLPDDAVLSSELKRLHVRGILSREPIEGGYGSACHPILRDHFRTVLLGTGTDTAKRAADLLKGQPSDKQPQSVKEIELVLLAIELLLDAEDFQAADALYRERLENGQVFKWIPARPEGMACALGFVRDETRRKQCEEKLSRARMRYYLNDVGLFASHSGHYEQAHRYYTERIALAREMQDAISLAVGLRNEAELLVFLGQPVEAQHAATMARDFATQAAHETGLKYSHAYHGWASTLTGQCQAAAEDFATANELEKKNDPDGDELYSSRGVWWAELLFLSGHSALAKQRTQANLRICERNHWNHDIARSHWMLACCALAEGRLDDAQAELHQAEPIFHRGQMLFELARLHVTAGQVSLARQDAEGALHQAAEALDLAAPRGMRLVHANALVLRGRARLLESTADSAVRTLDDAEEALHLARECRYAWAERDALFLRADAATAFANAYQSNGQAVKAEKARGTARQARADAEALAARLRLTKEDLAAAEAKAKAWMAEREKQRNQDDDSKE